MFVKFVPNFEVSHLLTAEREEQVDLFESNSREFSDFEVAHFFDIDKVSFPGKERIENYSIVERSFFINNQKTILVIHLIRID